MSKIKLKLHENGKLKELEIDWKFIAALSLPITMIIKLIVKWVIIFIIAFKGLVSDPTDGKLMTY